MAWPVNARTSAMMDEAQALYGATITATQGSPNIGVGASAGTHDGEGVIDVSGADLDAIVTAMRQVGFAAWHRTTAEGFSPHVHGVAVGEPDLSSAAADQVTDYIEGRNGLATNAPDDGPRDWVGQTWEGYQAGDPPSGGTRPFRGVQIGPAVVIVTAGPLVDSDIYDGIFDRSDAETIALSTGDEFYFYLNQVASNPTDVYSMANWRLNASGHGSVDLADAFDAGYSFSPPFSWTELGSVSVDSDALALTATTASTVTPDLLDGALGGLMLRVTCVSGTVTLDWACLQVEPPAGLLAPDVPAGYWSAVVVPAPQALPAVVELRRVIGEVLATITDRDTATAAMNAAWDAARSATPTRLSDITMVTSGGATDIEPDKVRVSTSWSTAKYESVPTDYPVSVLPPLLAGLENGVDFAPIPGQEASLVPDRYIDTIPGTEADYGWDQIYITVSSPAKADTTTGALVSAGNGVVLPGGATLATVSDFDADVTVAYNPPDGSDWTLRAESSYEHGLAPDIDYSITPPFGAGFIGISAGASGGTANLLYKLPDYRYWHPGWIRSPDALDTSDPEGAAVVITWLRQRQRNDGLGNSVIRARGSSSRQMSLRQRGYR